MIAPARLLRIALLASVALAAPPAIGATSESPGQTRTVRLAAAATTEGRPASIAEEILGERGPVVAFVSGLGGDRQGWRAVAEAIAPCARALIYDRPGLGGSTPIPQSPVLAAAAADDLAGILHASALPGPYLLVGHSLGGLYVQAFARSRPETTRGVVLVDAMTPLQAPGFFTYPTALDGTAATAEDIGIPQSLKALRSGPPFPPVPLSVIVASRHNGTPEREAARRDAQQRTAALSPLGHLVVAEGAGHFVQGDRPDVVVAAILETLAASGADVAACR